MCRTQNFGADSVCRPAEWGGMSRNKVQIFSEFCYSLWIVSSVTYCIVLYCIVLYCNAAGRVEERDNGALCDIKAENLKNL
jgi:predicted amidohydrolase